MLEIRKFVLDFGFHHGRKLHVVTFFCARGIDAVRVRIWTNWIDGIRVRLGSFWQLIILACVRPHGFYSLDLWNGAIRELHERSGCDSFGIRIFRQEFRENGLKSIVFRDCTIGF